MNARCLSLRSEPIRSLACGSERSFGRIFLFLFNFGQGPIRDKLIHSLVPVLQTLITFTPFVQIQRNQRSRLRYDLLYPVKQLKYVFEKFKI